MTERFYSPPPHPNLLPRWGEGDNRKAPDNDKKGAPDNDKAKAPDSDREKAPDYNIVILFTPPSSQPSPSQGRRG